MRGDFLNSGSEFFFCSEDLGIHIDDVIVDALDCTETVLLFLKSDFYKKELSLKINFCCCNAALLLKKTDLKKNNLGQQTLRLSVVTKFA